VGLFVANVAAAFTVLENFEAYANGAFPSKWRRRSDEALRIYRVESENGNHFLRAYADKQAVQIGLESVFDPNEQRRLIWRWRARQLPFGSNERNPEKHDAAAQVYVIFDNHYWPRIIKYIWSATPGFLAYEPGFWRRCFCSVNLIVTPAQLLSLQNRRAKFNCRSNETFFV